MNSKTQVRKRVREPQIKAKEARIGRDRHTSMMRRRGWSSRVAWRLLMSQSTTESRRCVQKRSDAGMSTARPGAAVVARMQARGESRAAIAELAPHPLGATSMDSATRSTHAHQHIFLPYGGAQRP